MKDPIDLWTRQLELSEGLAPVCGVDEAGRGPLAGPVCAAAVILPEGLVIEGLNDSKKLTARKREALYERIVSESVSYGIAFAEVEEIEQSDILSAALLAMNRAMAQLDPQPALALIDGNTTRSIAVNARSVIGGDGLCASIAAASVLAKVTRDRLMVSLAEKYPQYGFAKHKGYGTKAHYAAIAEYGPCEIHRRSFLRKFYADRR